MTRKHSARRERAQDLHPEHDYSRTPGKSKKGPDDPGGTLEGSVEMSYDSGEDRQGGGDTRRPVKRSRVSQPAYSAPATAVIPMDDDNEEEAHSPISTGMLSNEDKDESMPGEPVLEKPRRIRLRFPVRCELSTAGKHTWYMGLLRQHPDAEPLFKEGRNAPYITIKDGPLCSHLTTEGFQNVVLEEFEEQQRVVLIHDVPTYANANLLECPLGFLWLKRRMIGQHVRPQLLGGVVGEVPQYVKFTGIMGQKRVTVYTPEPDLCRRCSRWGHKEWRCRSAFYRCRYCAGRHNSDICFEKIRQGAKFPPMCCNCGGSHNAQSGRCPAKPRASNTTYDTSRAPTTQNQRQITYQPAPQPHTNAWHSTPHTTEFPSLPSQSQSSLPSVPQPSDTACSPIDNSQQNLINRLIDLVTALTNRIDSLDSALDVRLSALEARFGITSVKDTASTPIQVGNTNKFQKSAVKVVQDTQTSVKATSVNKPAVVGTPVVIKSVTSQLYSSGSRDSSDGPTVSTMETSPVDLDFKNSGLGSRVDCTSVVPSMTSKQNIVGGSAKGSTVACTQIGDTISGTSQYRNQCQDMPLSTTSMSEHYETVHQAQALPPLPEDMTSLVDDNSMEFCHQHG